MLAKKNRLNLSLKQNSSIFEKGSSILVSSEFFLAYLRFNQNSLKITCLTPKATTTKATLRNYYRRFLYSLIENQIQNKNLSINMNLDLVIILKKNFVEDKNALSSDFSILVKKILTHVNSDNV